MVGLVPCSATEGPSLRPLASRLLKRLVPCPWPDKALRSPLQELMLGLHGALDARPIVGSPSLGVGDPLPTLEPNPVEIAISGVSR